MPFSSTDLRVIESFASQLGLPVRPARDGSFSFTFEGTRRLTLTPPSPDDGVVVTVSWTPAHIDAGLMGRCLGEGGFDAETDAVIHAGLDGAGSLMLSTRFEANEISLPAIETCMQDLFARRARVGS